MLKEQYKVGRGGEEVYVKLADPTDSEIESIADDLRARAQGHLIHAEELGSLDEAYPSEHR